MKRSVFADVRSPAAGEDVQIHLAPQQLGRSLSVDDLVDVEGTWSASATGHPTLFVERLRTHRGGAGSPPGDFITADADVLARLRAHLGRAGFAEVMTSTWLPRYNGGSSTPFEVRWKGEPAGWLRVTFEERMLAVLADRLTPVYQIGPVFKGGRELALLEAYRPAESLDDARAAVAGAIRAAAGRHIEPSARVDFAAALRDLLGGVRAAVAWRALATGDGGVLSAALPVALPPRCSPYRASLDVAQALAREAGGLVEVTALPASSSPLYASADGPLGPCAQQSKIFYAGDLVADLGVQECEPDRLAAALAVQRTGLVRLRAEAADGMGVPDVAFDDREILDVVRRGLPDCVGFSVRIEPLARLADRT